MARTRKPETAAPETAQGTSFSSAERPSRQPAAAQETQDTQNMAQDAQAQETVPDSAQGGAESVQDVQGTQDTAQDTQVQEMSPDGAQGGRAEKNVPPALLEYAVAGCKFLNLRERPGLDAPVITRLPCGVGVVLLNEAVVTADEYWWRVRTGTLDGWVMAEYLLPIWN